MSGAPSPTVVQSYAEDFTVVELNTRIVALREAFETSSFSSLGVLGLNVGHDGERTELLLETMLAARKIRTQADDATGAVEDVNLDARKPLGHGFDFSGRMIS